MKLAVTERNEAIDLSLFDKVVSYSISDRPNIDRYISLDEVDAIKKQAWLNLEAWLEDQADNSAFKYRDIHMLQAYGLVLYDYYASLSQRALALRRLIDTESPAEIWIPRNEISNDDPRFPCLSSFVESVIPPNISVKFFEAPRSKNEGHQNFLGNKALLLKAIKTGASACRKFLNIFYQTKHGRILICSDLDKIPVLLERLKESHTIFLREELPESLMGRFLESRADLWLFSDFKISPKEEDEIKKTAELMIARAAEIKEPLYSGDIDFAPHVKKFLIEIWKKQLCGALKKAAQGDHLFEKSDIRSLMVDEDKSVTKHLLVQLCKRHGVPSYVNCHGEPFLRVGYLPLVADKILLWGTEQKKLFLEWGLPESRMIVVGCSKFDNFLETPANELKRKICKDLKLNVSKPIALIAPIPLSKRGDDVLESAIWQLNREVICIADRFKDLQLVIKLHPYDESGLYLDSLLERLGSKKIRILKNYAPLTLTKGSDFLISSFSTIAVDGLAYRKPVIFFENRSMDKYKHLEFFYNGTSAENLEKSIQGLLDGSCTGHMVHWRSSVDAMLNGMDGKASDRIAALLSTA